MIRENDDDDNIVDGRCDGKCVQDDDDYGDDDINGDDDVTDDDDDDTDYDDDDAEVVAASFDWDN